MHHPTAPWFALTALVVAFCAAAVSAAPGDLDPSFGGGGRVVTDLFGEAWACQATRTREVGPRSAWRSPAP